MALVVKTVVVYFIDVFLRHALALPCRVKLHSFRAFYSTLYLRKTGAGFLVKEILLIFKNAVTFFLALDSMDYMSIFANRFKNVRCSSFIRRSA